MSPYVQNAYGGYGAFAAPVFELAGRGSRLAAAIIDNLATLLTVAAAIFIGAALGNIHVAIGILFGALLVLAIAAVQLGMLHTYGQTIGKRVLGIRIVKFDTGQNGGWVTNIIVRGLVPGLLGAMPYIGILFSLVNILFIFREDRRCVHDLIAGTIVVAGDP